jgi:hypothetical protein
MSELDCQCECSKHILVIVGLSRLEQNAINKFTFLNLDLVGSISFDNIINAPCLSQLCIPADQLCALSIQLSTLQLVAIQQWQQFRTA